MPTFDTPKPILLILDRIVGDIHVVATERIDTTVSVRPASPSNPADVRGAERTIVDFSAGSLLVTGPKQPNFIGRTESIDILVELPAASRVDADLAMGNFTSQGPLGEVRLRTALGDMRLEATGGLRVHGSYGPLTVDLIDGDADVSTGGAIHVGAISGKGTIRNSNGSTTVGESSRSLSVKAANGDIEVQLLNGDLTARTACGGIRVDEIAGGTALLETGAGEVRVGIRPGVPAFLDLESDYGHVVNTLEPSAAPAEPGAGARITARTPYGDIVVGQSTTTKGAA